MFLKLKVIQNFAAKTSYKQRNSTRNNMNNIDTNYSKSYKKSMNLINWLSNQKLSVANLNTEKKLRIDSRTTKYDSNNNNESLNREAIKWLTVKY